ncbi:unnamed protein product [Nippostrongylus brasiliensis]|uniref:AB hydrolase-1 domain-containing protein n=1 Tax=Nippostrongylus brasiliensis TaxID=27835 RepID=A0A158R3K3_NIPBR|nr:unnamed protein product [Nippostrongylus brasiliensis]
MGNFRGNSYSNKRLKNDSREESNYWKFSWEEMSKYDLPAMINHALKKSGQPSLYYVGHSQGTLTMLAKLSKDQGFSKKIRKFFLLAPVSRLARVKGVFHLMGEIYENYKLYLDLFGDSESLANNALLTSLMKSSCDSSKGLVNCQSLLFAVGGPNSHQFNNSRIGIYLAHNPSGTSVRNMVHFSQMVHSKKMASFDEGPQENLELYGQIEPPEYDLSKVHGDLYLFYSEYDWIASPADAEGYLIPTLPKNCVKLARFV